MNFWNAKWDLDEAQCPCDLHFNDWIEDEGLTGKTISANFDPWRTDAFGDRLGDITRSDLWTMRRVNIVNLPEGDFTSTLFNTRATYTVTPRMSTSALVQFNSTTSSVSTNVRFRRLRPDRGVALLARGRRRGVLAIRSSASRQPRVVP